MNTDKCKNCGKIFESTLKSATGEKVPCPHCGSMLRDLDVSVNDGVKVSDYMTSVSKRGDRETGFRESLRDGRATSADINDDGSVSYSNIGSSPQNEEDALTICQILIEYLNKSGGNWEQPTSEENEYGNVDCRSCNKKTGKNLYFQVTRAKVDTVFWERLNRENKIDIKNEDKVKIVEDLKKAIEKKADERKIPFALRKDLDLVLDANRLPSHAFRDIQVEFLSKYGNWVSNLGFNAIWIVGPVVDLVRRLDKE